MNAQPLANKFVDALGRHARAKSILYDGINATLAPYKAISLAAEELGEIASAVIRDRPEAAKAECLDLAHCAMLIYISLCNEGNE